MNPDQKAKDVKEVYTLLANGDLTPDRVRLALDLAWTKGFTEYLQQDIAKTEARRDALRAV